LPEDDQRAGDDDSAESGTAAKAIVVLLAVVLTPLIVEDVFFLWRYPLLRMETALQWRMAYRVGGLALAVVPWCVIRIPIILDSEGIRFAWFHRIRWQDVAAARVRTSFGFRVLELHRHGRRPLRAWLVVYDGLPAFLAAHAPEGNPLRQLSNVGS